MRASGLYLEKTKEVIRAFIQSDGRCGYEKMLGSSYQGFVYEKRLKDSGRVIVFDLRLPEEGTLIFEAAPGIHVSSKDYLPTIKRYCQENIMLKYGAVNVNGENIQFHIENCLMDNPISKETLEKYETEAIRVLELHQDNLYNMAIGRFLSCTSVTESKSISSFNNNCAESVNSIRDFLSNRSRHNSVCERVNEKDNTLFYCQVMTGEKSFKLSFILSEDGILMLKGVYGENAFVVSEPYRYAVAEYLNDENAGHKYSSLSLGANGEGVSCNMCTSLLDGTIGDKTIEFMEYIVLKTLSDSIEKIEKLGAGFLIIEDQEEAKLKKVTNMPTIPLSHMMNPSSGFRGMSRPAPGQVIDSFVRDNTQSDDEES